MLNNWSEQSVKRAEKVWGSNFPKYTVAMFDAIIGGGKSYLDLGCGFGRFLQYLLKKVPDADYVGYDSSPAMVERIKERFPDYSTRIFLHNVTDPIPLSPDCILCSAVMIHITREDQLNVLKAVKNARPKLFVFDINHKTDQKRDFFESVMRQADGDFRMSWQSPEGMLDQLKTFFPGKHEITSKSFPITKTYGKTCFFVRNTAENIV